MNGFVSLRMLNGRFCGISRKSRFVSKLREAKKTFFHCNIHNRHPFRKDVNFLPLSHAFYFLRLQKLIFDSRMCPPILNLVLHILTHCATLLSLALILQSLTRRIVPVCIRKGGKIVRGTYFGL